MKIVKITKGNEKESVSYMNNRGDADYKTIDATVSEIIEKVKLGGDDALSEYIERFDGAKLDKTPDGKLDILVSPEEIEEAVKTVDSKVYAALTTAAENIKSYHEKQLDKSWSYEKEDGVRLGQLVTPIENVGLYVPGGKAVYPSTVLMNSIPAVIAGVKRIAIATPPGKDGKVNPVILAAAKIVGVSEIYKMGGAQAIAAFAYGTPSVPAVDKIAGPGNAFVTRAKKMVYGVVDIDMIAGPSEVCVIADDSADPTFAAADLLSQSEHDEMSCSVFITNSESFAETVMAETERQLSQLDRENISRVAIENNCVLFVADDIDSCFEISNQIVPEHLEILLPDALQHMSKIRNAGAAFFGKYTPQPLGDYVAGPNHTLPTAGTARFASPLGVYDFLKRTSIIYYTEEALEKIADTLLTITDTEGLTAHGKSISVRLNK